MAKFYGNIGYAKVEQTSPGVWKNNIAVRPYYGELGRNVLKVQSSEHLNDNINIANEVSIIADAYANENFHSMKYIEFMGAKWKITNVEVKHPRLILTVGGVYNE